MPHTIFVVIQCSHQRNVSSHPRLKQDNRKFSDYEYNAKPNSLPVEAKQVSSDLKHFSTVIFWVAI